MMKAGVCGLSHPTKIRPPAGPKRAGECYLQGTWNTYRIICIGTHLQIYVNDTLTTDIYDGMDLKGYLGIQHHGEKGLIYQFRNLRIKDLGAGGEIYYPHRENAAAAAVASKMAGDIYEAEAARMTDCTKANNPSGFQGTGFVTFKGQGSSIEWDNVLADQNGQYKLTFRYAAANNKSCELYVNSQKVGTLAFAGTGNQTTWQTNETNVTFKKGGNVVKVVAIDAGLNLDALAVNKVK
jgi:hypothetical protein